MLTSRLAVRKSIQRCWSNVRIAGIQARRNVSFLTPLGSGVKCYKTFFPLLTPWKNKASVCSNWRSISCQI